MAKHRRQNVAAKRGIATATAVLAGATLMAPTQANAAEVRVPNGPAFEVPGIENVPGIANIPGIHHWIPSLEGKATNNQDVQNAINAVKNIPGIDNVPGFKNWINDVERRYVPAQKVAAVSKPAPAKAAAPAQSQGDRIVSIARSKIGSPYVYGASGPNAFDCSGFTSWVYAQAGKQIPRTSQAQASAGRNVAISDLKPGDIVVYYGGASHVAIYAGNGKIIDALNSGTPVGERPLHMMPIHSAVRF